MLWFSDWVGAGLVTFFAFAGCLMTVASTAIAEADTPDAANVAISLRRESLPCRAWSTSASMPVRSGRGDGFVSCCIWVDLSFYRYRIYTTAVVQACPPFCLFPQAGSLLLAVSFVPLPSR